jgi:hypothetical protein
MTSYHGQIELGAIQTPGAPPDTPVLKARFVHYPDCQQLTVWLPDYGRDYGRLRIVERGSGTATHDGPVTDWLNGSIQLLFDTVPLPPGDYALSVEHPAGWRHQLEFRKLAVDVKPKPAEPEPPPTFPDPDGGQPPVYRDGFGRVIPDEAAAIRARAHEQLVRTFLRRLEYEGTFRSGYVTYIEGAMRFRLVHEMGGGGCHCYIELPQPAQWEAQTGTPLARRDEIVQWIAERVQRDQAPSWRFEIRDDAIVFR